MKKFFMLILLSLVTVVFTGCSLHEIRSNIEGRMGTVIEKDQQNQQGFVVTSEMVYDAYDTQLGYINMRNKELRGIPDFCSLLEASDHSKIRHINLANNNIKLVNQDLSCLENLVKLNLSYNQIEQVTTLGELPNLRELLLHKNEIQTTQNFPNFPALEKLSLAYNKLREVEGVDHLINLVQLELQHNNISQIIGVENLEKLEQLRVEFNNLTELDFIKELENLQFVSAKGNELKETVLEELQKLNDQFSGIKDALNIPSSNNTGGAAVEE